LGFKVPNAGLSKRLYRDSGCPLERFQSASGLAFALESFSGSSGFERTAARKEKAAKRAAALQLQLTAQETITVIAVRRRRCDVAGPPDRS
jgi:hypothetical protein